MNLHKEAFTGTGKVFAFTLRQLIFNKANIISIVILMLISLLGMPVMSLIKGGSFQFGSGSDSQIAKIFYINESQWKCSPEDIITQDEDFADIPFEQAVFSMDELKTNGTETYLKEGEIVLLLADSVQVYGTDSVNMEYENLARAAGDALQKNRLIQAGASTQQIQTAEAHYSTDTSTMTEYYKDLEGPDFGVRYGIQYAYAIILMMICMFTTSYILRAVIEEKASKLVELLMVSVRPLALIMGKILAVMLYVFGMLVVMGMCFGISSLLTMTFMNTSSGMGAVLSMITGSGATFDSLQIDSFFIFAVLISFVLGYLTFSILSGLAGCSCSNMEDMESASMNVVLVLMAGYMVSVVAINFRSVAILVSLVPIISIFCAPIEYVCGNIGIGILFLSWVIQIVTVAFLFQFCARIYQSLILHKGEKLKVMQMIRLSKTIKNKQKAVKKNQKREGRQNHE